MPFSTTVRLFSAQNRSLPLPGVRVELYDRDRFSPDDQLASGVTDASGTARMTFSSQAFADLDDAGIGPVSSLPDLYVLARDGSGNIVISTRSSATNNAVPPEILVFAEREQIARLRPSKTQSTAVRQREWIDARKKRLSRDPGPGGVDLCLTRVIVDMLAGATNPTNSLQKQTATALRSKLTPAQIKMVAGKAAQARELLDTSGLLGASRCSSDSPDDLTKLLFSPGAPLSRLTQALTTAIEQPPIERAGRVQAGTAHTVPYQWDAKCVQRFKGQLAPPLTGQPLSDMQRFYHEPNDLEILEAPRINEVHVFEPAIRHTIRKGVTESRELTLWSIDREGLREDSWNMSVPNGHQNFLVNQLDSPGGNQVLVVDVIPGQPVTIKGRNFISARASVSALFGEWEPIPGGVSEAQVLTPRPGQPDPRWSAVDVHGSNPDGHDWIVFDWPIWAAPGLYQMTFQFENTTGRMTASRVRQNSSTCELGLSGDMITQTVYFAVLPPLASRAVKVRATRVTCEDLTNPEIWPDDVALVGTTQLNRIRYDSSDPAGARIVTESIATHAWDKGHELCWQDNSSFTPGDANILPGSEVAHQLQMDRTSGEVMVLTLIGAELESDADRAVLIALSLAVTVAVWILIASLILAAAVILTIFVIIIGVVVGILSTVGAPAIATVAGAVIGGIWVVAGALLTATAGLATAAGGGATALILAFVDDFTPVASATTFISAGELSLRLSDVKFHRRIWDIPRPPAGSVEVSTQFDPRGFHEQYKGSNNGGTYKLFLDIEP